MTTYLDTLRDVSLPFENTVITHFADILRLLDDKPPLHLSIYLGVYIFHYRFYKVKIHGRISSSSYQLLVLIIPYQLPQKSIIPSFRYIPVVISFYLL